MNIGIYNPYLDSLGGGERYCLDIATCLALDGHQVNIFWDDPTILTRAGDRFHIDVKSIRLVKNIWKKSNVFAKAQESRRYDVIFFVSDGSIPLIFSKKSFLIFQFPVPWVNKKNIITQLKLRRITNFLCYSSFVKEHVDGSFGINTTVLPPVVDTKSFPMGKKERLILSVGRFTTGMNTKKQALLILAFKRLCKEGIRDWKLVLAGGLLPGDKKFVEELVREAKGYPIEIIPNVSYTQLQSYYAKARIYWHAAGFGEDLAIHPERAEHFGLTTLEAMSAGVVPVVYKAGGQKEVVGNSVNGFLWKTEDELIALTRFLIKDTKTWSRISQTARSRAQEFSRDRFYTRIRTLI